MINPQSFLQKLKEHGIDFFTGVPDSLLTDLCACITDSVPEKNHVIAVNEGSAVGLASGYHLASGMAAAVYMQNSGTGNALNPLLSLADPEVYSIPMLLIIGWRGEPGAGRDEPQHAKQGKVQKALLEAAGYPFRVLSFDEEEAMSQTEGLIRTMYEKNTPAVLLIRKNTFSRYKLKKTADTDHELTREEALKIILDYTGQDSLIVSTTGKTSREIYELREKAGVGHGNDFLTVGSMGHSLMIALGLAQFQDKKVYCIDGDGAVLMHMGSLGTAAVRSPENLYHIIINNGAHESVGGQPTIGFSLSFTGIAQSMGYKSVFKAETRSGLHEAMKKAGKLKGLLLIEVKVRQGSRKDLGRPATGPAENKEAFMKNSRDSAVCNEKGIG